MRIFKRIRRCFQWNPLSPTIAVVGMLILSTPLEVVRAESLGETFIQLMVPGPDGRHVPLKMHEGMILSNGSIIPTDLFDIQNEILGITDGNLAVYQGVLQHPLSPGTLTITDGVHQWTQETGSNHSNFSVTYSPSTRNTFIIYSDNVPESGRKIEAMYGREAAQPINNTGTTGLRLQLVRDVHPEKSLIYSDGNALEAGHRIDIEISGDLLHWERIHLSSSFVNETGVLAISDHVFSQEIAILKTDGVSATFENHIQETPLPGSLLITDGTYTWSQAEGSSSPDDFNVTYTPETRSLVVAYPSGIPNINRVIYVNYDVKVRDAHATFVRLINNSKYVPIGFAQIPAGSFTMGRTSGDIDSNAPPVNVYVSEFYMAKHEVTWQLWNQVRTWGLSNGYTEINAGGGKGALHPVHWVNWWNAVMWCNARSEMEGLTPVYYVSGNVMRKITSTPVANLMANGYRLPTEAEWEKAARGGVSGQRFPWGETITHIQANYTSSSTFSYDTSLTRGLHPTFGTGHFGPYTSPVGSFLPNGYGLYDMAGNVFEWCWDWYGSTYTNDSIDPRGPASGSGRILRGGSWDTTAANCRSAYRGALFHAHDSESTGFRTVRSFVP